MFFLTLLAVNLNQINFFNLKYYLNSQMVDCFYKPHADNFVVCNLQFKFLRGFLSPHLGGRGRMSLFEQMTALTMMD